MPPKAKKNEPSKKTVEKQKQRVVEDKTFGLKNKKGAKTQKFISQVEKQVVHGTKSAKELDKLKLEKEKKKEDKKKEVDELNMLFKPVVELQKVAAGVDPKSVLCAFFKQGLCKKGDKCKFSHDLNVARKAEKRSLYHDIGNEDGDGTEESKGGMDGWDQAELESVVHKKHGESNKGLPQTTIICKFFLDAVENSKYGWFWECPNGKTCHYIHALPPGFILKKDKKRMEDMKEEVSLEELIERERMALGPEQTKVTLNSFIEWKKRKRQERKSKQEADKAKRKADYKQGRVVGISGREMFEFNPELVVDEDDEEGGTVMDTKRENDDSEESGPIREIRFDEYDEENYPMQQDPSPHVNERLNGASAGDTSEGAGKSDVSPSQLLGACGGTDPESRPNDTGGVAIDEDLFNDDDLEDLDEELEKLEVDEEE